MKTLNVDSDRIAIVSDIHWGKSRDSATMTKISEDFFEHLFGMMMDRDIKNLFFLGDWFDNRNTISVKTSWHSFKAFSRLLECGVKVYMVVGNHDSFLKESVEVNSLVQFGRDPNVFVVSEPTTVVFPSATGALFPWGTFDPQRVSDSKRDVLFGHFDFQGAQLVGSVNESGIAVEDILKLSPLVFSGHFHIRREYIYKNGKIVSVGCPFELDWGDYANEKAVVFFDASMMSYESVPNDFSPRHRKIFWSKVLNRTDDLKGVKGNFVKLIVDEAYKFEHVTRVLSLINGMGPLRPCETEFVYNTVFFNQLKQTSASAEDSIHLTALEYINRFIDQHAGQLDAEVNVDKLKEMVMSYYSEFAE